MKFETAILKPACLTVFWYIKEQDMKNLYENQQHFPMILWYNNNKPRKRSRGYGNDSARLCKIGMRNHDAEV